MHMVICGCPEKVWNANFHQELCFFLFFLRGHVGATATFQPAATHAATSASTAKFRSFLRPIESKNVQRQFRCFSGLSDGWCSCAMGCCCFSGNIQDRLATGRTPHEKKTTPVQRPDHTSRANNSHTPIQDVVGWMHSERRADVHWSGDLLIADWDDLEKSIGSDRSPRQKNRVPGRPSHQGTYDGSLKQEEHVVPRPLRHRQVQKEGVEAGGDYDAQIQPPTSNEAGGDSNTDHTLPRKPQYVKREVTEKKGDFCCMSDKFFYSHHFARRGQLYVPKE